VQLGPGLQDGVGGDGAGDVDPGRLRVDDGDPAAHQLVEDPVVERATPGGQLPPVVAAQDVVGVLRDVAADRGALLDQQPEDVGDVLLALVVVGVDPGESPPERRRVADVDTGVDLPDGPLLGGGVALLDDRPDTAVGTAHDATEAGRLVDLSCEDGENVARGAVGLHQAGHRGGPQQRGVTVHEEDRPLQVGQRVERHGRGVTRAPLLLLDDGHRARRHLRQMFLDESAAGPHDDDRGPRVQRLGRCQHVPQETPPAQGVQHLGRRRAHAGPLTGRQDDDGGHLRGSSRGFDGG